jgi:hypothetical protein
MLPDRTLVRGWRPVVLHGFCKLRPQRLTRTLGQWLEFARLAYCEDSMATKYLLACVQKEGANAVATLPDKRMRRKLKSLDMQRVGKFDPFRKRRR